MGEQRNIYIQHLVEKPERGGEERERKKHGRLRHRLEDNIKMDSREIGWEGMYCVHLAEGGHKWPAVVNT
jgi:hypothetical protein